MGFHSRLDIFTHVISWYDEQISQRTTWSKASRLNFTPPHLFVQRWISEVRSLIRSASRELSFTVLKFLSWQIMISLSLELPFTLRFPEGPLFPTLKRDYCHFYYHVRTWLGRAILSNYSLSCSFNDPQLTEEHFLTLLKNNILRHLLISSSRIRGSNTAWWWGKNVRLVEPVVSKNHYINKLLLIFAPWTTLLSELNI